MFESESLSPNNENFQPREPTPDFTPDDIAKGRHLAKRTRGRKPLIKAELFRKGNLFQTVTVLRHWVNEQTDEMPIELDDGKEWQQDDESDDDDELDEIFDKESFDSFVIDLDVTEHKLKQMAEKMNLDPEKDREKVIHKWLFRDEADHHMKASVWKE